MVHLLQKAGIPRRKLPQNRNLLRMTGVPEDMATMVLDNSALGAGTGQHEGNRMLERVIAEQSDPRLDARAAAHLAATS